MTGGGAPVPQGLTDAEARARLEQFGYNEVAEPRPRPLRALVAKFWGLSAWMLEFIMALSVVLHKYSDLAIVSALLVINAVLGFLQERRAAGVVEALRRRLQVNARVLRAGAWRLLAARELVPGDVVRLRAGDIVPADLTLLSGALEVDESALTGESAEVGKAAGGNLSSGSLVRRGEGDGQVSATGARTYFGRTTQLVQEARPKLHIEAVVARVVRALLIIVGALLAGVAVVSVSRHATLLEMVPLLLVLLMSAIPVALPVMFTVSMAVGARDLARRGVLVTRLNAAEDAATMDVLCVDKTGTITLNQLELAEVSPLPGATAAEVLTAAALASREANQDPIDLAILAGARAQGLEAALGAYVVRAFTPFDAATRRTEASVSRDGRDERVLKGAVSTVAALCGVDAAAGAALEARVAEAASRGHRTLAVARAAAGGPLTLLGTVALYDPPRADAGALIERLHGMGIAVKMLTGDALAVAREIGRGIGLPDIHRVGELEAAAPGSVPPADGFAEVYPEDKYVVVKRLQGAGHVTGMTGDGVNDAPALRQAEVGIAVSNATDVAKGAASVVLTEPGLGNIVALVEEGRAIYQRILTWILNKISSTLLKSAYVAAAYLVTGRFVISAFAMLLLTFMTDFTKIALSTDTVRAARRPETWRIGGYVAVATVLGVAALGESLGALWMAWTRLGLAADPAVLHSFSFLTLIFFSVFTVVSVRERRAFFASRPSRALFAALAADLALGTLATRAGLPSLAPLGAAQTAALAGYAAAACLLLNDPLKTWMIRRWSPAAAG